MTAEAKVQEPESLPARVEAAVRVAFRQYGAEAGLREASFFSGPEWLEQGGEYFDDAVLVMTVDGLAYDLFHSTDDFGELLTTLLEPLGVYFDFGEEWEIGFLES